jgi:two-component system CheB/CheR fusion protein
LEAAAREQRRLGQELHDGVGSDLTGLALLADALAQELRDSSPAQAARAARIASGLEEVRRQLRRLASGLVPQDVAPDGLRAALEGLAVRVRERSGAACTVEGAGPVRLADPATATHLFRIAQEAVANALRHGRARHIDITLRADPAALTLSVRDDGSGLGGGPPGGAGLGLRLMHDRARAIGGALTIGPAGGGGTVMTCVLPGDKSHGRE